MKPPGLSLFLLMIFLFSDVEAQMGKLQPSDSGGDNVSNTFRPSIAVVIGILSITFSLTCLLLVYAKFCHTSSAELFNGANDLNHQLGMLRSRRFSGIDKTVIESLPFFRFSSLKGTKEGLECSVCLSKFEDPEILRLLPKCRHAFHISCVDKWLESHSSCPLCRYKVEVNDLAIFTYSNSLRRDGSDLREEPNFELLVQREADRDASARFSVGSTFWKPDKSKKDEKLLPEGSEDPQFFHKFKHRIIVSDVVFKNRWSDLNSADLMFLNSDMLNVTSSQRFASLNSESNRFVAGGMSVDDDGCFTNDRIMTIREEMEKKRALERKVSVMNGSVSVSALSLPSTSTSQANSGNESKFLLPAGKRSMSEITNMSRFVDLGDRSRIRESSTAKNSAREEKVRRLWLPIARRTVTWLAGRERRSQSQQARRVLNV